MSFATAERHGVECNTDTDVVSPSGTSSSGQERAGIIIKSRPHMSDDDNDSNVIYPDIKSPDQK